MKRLASVLTSISLLFGVMFIAPTTVLATGNCSDGNVYLFRDNRTGPFEQFCVGVNDSDIEGENVPSLTLGPLWDGAYTDDWDTVHTTSGISSWEFYEHTNDGSNRKVCIYSGKGYVGLMVWLTANGQGSSFGGANNNIPGSFRFRLETEGC